MSFTRRSFLVGTASGFSVLVLAACTDASPEPSPTPTGTSSTDIPAALAFSRSKWSSDPYALGATSYLGVGRLPESREVLQRGILDRVFLAGDGLSEAPGTVRGAISSGRAAAVRVLEVTREGERVAIIGAGAAGTSAATLLTASGTDVIVVEARDRTGGRIDSKAVGDDFFELGAWRLGEVDDADLIETMTRDGMEFAPIEGGSAYALAGEDAPVELPADDPAVVAASAAPVEAATWAQSQPEDVSVSEALRDGVDWPAAEDVTPELLLEQVFLDVAGMTGADADALSAWFSTPTPQPSVVPLGPLSSFIDNALEGIDTVVSTTVAGIAYNDEGVSLRLGTGESLSVDRVIVTVPVGVLKEQVIDFDPVLPLTHRGALNDLSVGDIELVRMEFETAFWSTDATWWVREDDDEVIRLWVNLQPATGRPVLLGLVAGERARELAELNDDDLQAAARRSLEPFAS